MLALALVSFASFAQGRTTGLEIGKGGSLTQPKLPPHAPDHIVVKFVPGLSTQAIQAVLQRNGLELDYANSGKYFVVATIPQARLTAGALPANEAKKISREAAVVWAEIDPVLEPDFVPNDPMFDDQYALENVGQNGGTADADVDATDAWDEAAQFTDIVIAVCDDGFDMTHPDLIDNLYTNPNEIPGNGIDDDANGFIDDVNGWDFSDDDNDASPNPFDTHGTHVAGIIAATHDNNVGVSGVGINNLKYMPLRMYGGANGFMSALANAVDYAWENGASVISVSYNINNYTNALDEAVGRAEAADVIYCNSAGNSNEPNPNRQQLRADHENVIFVVSTDRNDNKSGFSNYGDLCEIAAPGSDIISTLTGGTYGAQSGTSMSTPLVSGILGMIWSTDMNQTAREVLDRVIDNADEVSGLDGFVPGSKRANLNSALFETGGATLMSITAFLGTHSGGDLASAAATDGNDVVVDSETVAGRGEYAGTEYLFDTGGIDATTVTGVSVEIENWASVDGVAQYLYFYNYTTEQFDVIRTTRLTSDLRTSTQTIRLGSSDYVDPATGEVRVRVLGLLALRRRGGSPEAFVHHTDRIEVSVNHR